MFVTYVVLFLNEAQENKSLQTRDIHTAHMLVLHSR